MSIYRINFKEYWATLLILVYEQVGLHKKGPVGSGEQGFITTNL